MRRLAVLVCVCALLAACGSDSGSGSASSTTSTTAPPGSAADRRIARAGLLRQSDLPGYAKVKAKYSEANDLVIRARNVPECEFFVQGNQQEVVNGRSPGFELGNSDVDSSVVVYATEAEAVAELELYRDPAIIGCLETLYRADYQDAGAQFTSVSPVDAPGADDGFGFLVTGTRVTPAGEQPVLVGIVGVREGRALASVNATGDREDITKVETTTLPVLQQRLRDAQA